jgi:hypothetical protein
MNNDHYETTEASSPEETPEESLLDRILTAIRIMTSVGAAGVIIIGVVMAVQLFSFFRGIIEEPTPTIAAWQQAMEDGRARNIPLVAGDEAPTKKTGAEPPTDTPSPAATKDAEPIAPKAVGADAVAPKSTVTVDAAPIVPEAVEKTASGGVGTSPAKDSWKSDDTMPHFVAFADRVMERLELGDFSWLVGVGFLTAFCWLLVKIPAMLITLGTRLLLGLLNERANS